MNGGMITQNVMPAGSNDTGVAVTVLEESTFIMNGGIISDNRTEKYGSSGIMVNRGGSAILNGGVIENNITQVRGICLLYTSQHYKRIYLCRSLRRRPGQQRQHIHVGRHFACKRAN